jgi:hypothetical protein
MDAPAAAEDAANLDVVKIDKSLGGGWSPAGGTPPDG